MRNYQVPPDTRDKEKIFGGIFTLSQFIFLVAGVIFGAVIGLLVFVLFKNIIVMIVGFVVGVMALVPFAFIKIRSMGDMELAKYVITKIRFNRRIKEFGHINTNYGGK